MTDLFPTHATGQTLRPYQEDAVAAVLNEWETKQATLGVAATGLGKTTMFAAIAKWATISTPRKSPSRSWSGVLDSLTARRFLTRIVAAAQRARWRWSWGARRFSANSTTNTYH